MCRFCHCVRCLLLFFSDKVPYFLYFVCFLFYQFYQRPMPHCRRRPAQGAFRDRVATLVSALLLLVLVDAEQQVVVAVGCVRCLSSSPSASANRSTMNSLLRRYESYLCEFKERELKVFLLFCFVLFCFVFVFVFVFVFALILGARA